MHKCWLDSDFFFLVFEAVLKWDGNEFSVSCLVFFLVLLVSQMESFFSKITTSSSSVSILHLFMTGCSIFYLQLWSTLQIEGDGLIHQKVQPSLGWNRATVSQTIVRSGNEYCTSLELHEEFQLAEWIYCRWIFAKTLGVFNEHKILAAVPHMPLLCLCEAGSQQLQKWFHKAG